MEVHFEMCDIPRCAGGYWVEAGVSMMLMVHIIKCILLITIAISKSWFYYYFQILIIPILYNFRPYSPYFLQKSSNASLERIS